MVLLLEGIVKDALGFTSVFGWHTVFFALPKTAINVVPGQRASEDFDFGVCFGF